MNDALKAALLKSFGLMLQFKLKSHAGYTSAMLSEMTSELTGSGSRSSVPI